jgi:hypothetical protein
MTAPIFTTSLVRELRGSPLTVLVAIMLLEQSGQVPATAQLLKDLTGYGDHTITDSLHALTSPTRQIVTRCAGGWRLSQGFQFPLEILSGENREYRGFEPTATTTTIDRHGDVFEAVAVEADQNREKRDLISPDQRVIHNILHREGRIGEPMATRLALMEGMSPIRALAHCTRAAFENIDTGLLIHRLRSMDDIEERYRRLAQERLCKEDYVSP